MPTFLGGALVGIAASRLALLKPWQGLALFFL